MNFDDLAVQALAAFGEAATYTPAGRSAFALSVVFDAPFVEIDDLAGPPVASQRIFVTVHLADFPSGINPLENDQLIARGTTYVVREVRPDGQGVARLMLNIN